MSARSQPRMVSVSGWRLSGRLRAAATRSNSPPRSKSSAARYRRSQGWWEPSQRVSITASIAHSWGSRMAQIRHIAIASDHPFKAAEFYKRAFGFREIARNGFDPGKPDEAPRPCSVLLTDGYLNISLLKLGK